MKEDDDLRLEKPVAAPGWTIPADMDLEGERLVYDHKGVEGRHEFVHEPGSQLLEEFLRLGEAPPATILAFARRWGPLYLCEHNLPAPHGSAIQWWEVPWTSRRHCRPRDRDGGGYWEPLSPWRNLAKQAAVVLKIAAQLLRGSKAFAADVRRLTELATENPRFFAHFRIGGRATRVTRQALARLLRRHPELGTVESYAERLVEESSLSAQRSGVGRVVQRWLDLADARVWFDWSGHAPQCKLGARSLFGALATKLAFAVLGTGAATCDGCGELYTPSRAPREGERHFCPSCRQRKVDGKLRARDFVAGGRRKKRRG